MLAVSAAAEAPIVPERVCDVLRDLEAHQGKPAAIVGRYSFRQDGRWLGEQACEDLPGMPPLLELTEDGGSGPKPPADFALDGTVLNRKLGEIRKHTSLGRFRFGTPDYDRWAVVYGRVEPRKGEDKKAAADLVFRGDGVIVFLPQ